MRFPITVIKINCDSSHCDFWDTMKSFCNFSECTFECALGHPVDLSTCRGAQQAVQPHKQQGYEQQQQHDVRASDLRSTVVTGRPPRDLQDGRRGCRLAGDETGLQSFHVLIVWWLYAIIDCLPPPDSLGSLPHCGAGHLSASLLRGTIEAWSGPWNI